MIGVSDRALEVQHLLVERGHLRVSLPDLLIASVAELDALSVLHYDADYDHIAGVSGQSCQWIASRAPSDCFSGSSSNNDICREPSAQ